MLRITVEVDAPAGALEDLMIKTGRGATPPHRAIWKDEAQMLNRVRAKRERWVSRLREQEGENG